MSKPSISKQETPWQRIALAAVVGASVIGAVVFWQSGGKEDAPTDVNEHKTSAVFGPGVLTDSGDRGSLSQSQQEAPAIQQIDAPGRLNVDGQQLVIDPQLLEVINYFLLEQSGTDRAAALQNYLKSKLPPPAFTQANSIIEHYRAYMKAHDNLLQGQNFGSDDIASRAHNIERLLTWREQRNRLRMDMLGENVTRAWYQNDDAELNQVLQELQQRQNNTATDGNGSGSRDVNEDAVHEQDMQGILNKATQSYAALTQEKHLWAQHMATFQAAVAQIKQQPNMTSLQRNHQIAELLQKTFPTEDERQRARDLMP